MPGAGFDVARQAQQRRSVIGLSCQYAAVDENLTVRENLVMGGRLYQLPETAARLRAGELLEQFALADDADRPVMTYSGGMRLRLGLWDVIRERAPEGTTILLTTQYLEQAD